MNQERLRQRMDSMRSSMEIAKYLSENPIHAVPVSPSGSEDTIEEIRDKYRFSRMRIAYFLNAVVLEIAIKMIWELDKAKECRNTHHIYQLYKELDPISQSDLRNLFANKAQMLADVEIEAQVSRLGELVQFQSWEDTLRANRDIMVNFKYDGKFSGKSSALGTVIWNNEDTLWVLPPLNFMRFPEAVYLYTLNRLERSPQ